jgi:hypothetical protein
MVTPNPSHEVVQDVTASRAYLAARGLAQVPVYAVVVVSNRETWSAPSSRCPVAHMHNALAVLRDNSWRRTHSGGTGRGPPWTRS